MSVRLNRLRIKCAKRIYDKTMKAGMLNVDWDNLAPEVRDGFEKMVSEVFDVLFHERVEDIIQFFTGVLVEVEKHDARN